MGKILPIPLKLNFTRNTSGCYRLISLYCLQASINCREQRQSGRGFRRRRMWGKRILGVCVADSGADAMAMARAASLHHTRIRRQRRLRDQCDMNLGEKRRNTTLLAEQLVSSGGLSDLMRVVRVERGKRRGKQMHEARLFSTR